MGKVLFILGTNEYIIVEKGEQAQVDDTKLVDYTPELRALVESGKKLWWVPDDPADPQGSGHVDIFVPLIEDVRAVKKAEIAGKRYEAEMGGFLEPNSGMYVRTDDRNRTLMAFAIQNAKNNSSYTVPNWKLADGTFTTLTGTMINALYSAMETFIAAQFAKEKALNDQINAAATVAEVESITW